jgi:hypothetical protein
MTTPDDFIRKDLTALRGLFLPNLDGDRAPDEIADTHLVHYVKLLMQDKLAAARKKGRGGWWDPERCSVLDLRRMLIEHVDKGDMRDVINLAAMVHARELVDGAADIAATGSVWYFVRRGADGAIEAQPSSLFNALPVGWDRVKARSLEHAKAVAELTL